MQQVAKKTKVALCPDCETQVKVGPTPKLGEKRVCPHCGAFLEIVGLEPLELDWDMGDYDDDWDADDDWDTGDDWE